MPGIEIAVKNIMNSYMSYEQSFKVKQSIYEQRQWGVHVGASSPYGYYKKPRSNKLYVDSVAAEIVQRIFRYTLEGKGRMEIARLLNMENVFTPGDYKKSKRNPDYVKKKEWTDATVIYVLKNKAYIGTLISGRNYRPEMGKRYVKRVPEEEWVVMGNAHEAIIPEKDFYAAQKTFKEYDHLFEGTGELLSGLLSCGHCRRALLSRKKRTGIFYYCDSHRINPERYQCNLEYISSDDLEEVIFQVIRMKIKVMADLKKMLQKTVALKKMRLMDGDEPILIETPEGQLKKQKKILYERYRNGSIELEHYLKEKERINAKLVKSSKEREDSENGESYRNQEDIVNFDFIDSLLCFENHNELNQEMLQTFIKRIYVYDKKHIEIVFRCEDEFEAVIKDMENLI